MEERPMRRQDRLLSPSETRDILLKAEWGTLATVGPDGCPYAVPLNYVLIDNTIFFHCATEGRKLDNIAFEPRVSFNVATGVQVLPEQVSTAYQSVTIFGLARLGNAQEKYSALKELLIKYTPMSLLEIENYLEKRKNDALLVYAIDIASMTGKRRPKP